MKRYLQFFLCFCMFWVARLAAADVEGPFGEANKLYEEGKYANAVAAYDKLIQGGQASVPIYFNRGTALLRMGKLGEAIAAYRQAELLAPRDPDVQANLRIARTNARGGVPFRTNGWERWLQKLSVNEWTELTAGTVWLIFLILALAEWRPGLGRRFRNLVVGLAMAAVFLGVCLGSSLKENYWDTTAIVTSGEVEVRNGPLDESQTAFKVRDGIELTVLDRKDGWLQVADPAQRLGWLRESQVIIFKPVPKR